MQLHCAGHLHVVTVLRILSITNNNAIVSMHYLSKTLKWDLIVKSYSSIPCFCCTHLYATLRSTKLGHFGEITLHRAFEVEQRVPFQYGGRISRSLQSHAASSYRWWAIRQPLTVYNKFNNGWSLLEHLHICIRYIYLVQLNSSCNQITTTLINISNLTSPHWS